MIVFKKLIIITLLTIFFATLPGTSVFAQEKIVSEQTKKQDITKPENVQGKEEVIALFRKRPETKPSFINFIAYSVQYSVKTGVPANTVLLILLIPLLATIIAFFRHVIGLPSLDMLVPIALSITLLATGLVTGLVLLTTILLASTLARLLLKNLRIMQLPKISLSVLIVAISVFAMLTISASTGILTVKEISIFPILLLIILSEKIVALQLERTRNEVVSITVVTLCLGIIGYFLLFADYVRQIVLLYPEVILILIPINIIIGRYFGLRLTEYFRFSPIIRHASK